MIPRQLEVLRKEFPWFFDNKRNDANTSSETNNLTAGPAISMPRIQHIRAVYDGETFVEKLPVDTELLDTQAEGRLPPTQSSKFARDEYHREGVHAMEPAGTASSPAGTTLSSVDKFLLSDNLRDWHEDYPEGDYEYSEPLESGSVDRYVNTAGGVSHELDQEESACIDSVLTDMIYLYRIYSKAETSRRLWKERAYATRKTLEIAS